MRTSRACLFLFVAFCLVMTLNSDPNTVDILLLLNNKSYMRILQLSINVVQAKVVSRGTSNTVRFIDRGLITALVPDKRKTHTTLFESMKVALQVPPHFV